jgi:hypothetical protein
MAAYILAMAGWSRLPWSAPNILLTTIELRTFHLTSTGLLMEAHRDPERVFQRSGSLCGRIATLVDPNLSSQTMNDSPLREIYVSTDIETDGPVAGKHSMLSIGSAAYLADKELLGTFSSNLETLPASTHRARTTLLQHA